MLIASLMILPACTTISLGARKVTEDVGDGRTVESWELFTEADGNVEWMNDLPRSESPSDSVPSSIPSADPGADDAG
jgi:hypothetical protein